MIPSTGKSEPSGRHFLGEALQKTPSHRRGRHRYERSLLKQKKKRKVLEESLIGVCASHAPLSLEAAARRVLRGCMNGGGKEGSRYQTCFNEVHIGRSIQSHGGRCYCTRAAGERDIRLCWLYARNYYHGPSTGFSSSPITKDKKTQTNLRAFRYAVNLSAERPVRVLHADAMCPRPLLACSKYLQRRQAQPHLRGLQQHGCSTRRKSQFSLENEMKIRSKDARHLEMILVESLS